MSVTVVKMTDPDSAGSIFSLSNITGTNTPASAAATMLNSMAKQITNPDCTRLGVGAGHACQLTGADGERA